MPGMEYDEDAAERLEAVYLGPDMAAQRADTLARLAIRPGERVLDIGSGPGFLATDMAEATGPSGQVTGVDLSPQMVARAAARATRPWLSYHEADATDLPFEDASFDVVVSTQVAEYVPDIAAFCAEVFRVLTPGGRGLILATDWDAVLWHSEDPGRMARVLAAFEPHCADSRLPRTLGARLRAAGLQLDGADCYPIVNADRHEGCYSQMILPFITAYVSGQGSVPDDVLRDWADEQDRLDARGAHFFSTGRFNFAVTRPA